jgi:acetylornithine/N-succinyldiaminopimelate aminotransferase
VESIRGEGLLMGMKMRTPNAEAIAALRQAGVLTVAAGDNVIRVMPPLIVEAADLRELGHRMDAGFAALARAAGKAA